MCGSAITWLDSHAGAIGALATVVLVVVTYLYMRLTKALVRLQAEQMQRAVEPLVVPQVLGADPDGLLLRLTSVGSGPAIDVYVLPEDESQQPGPRIQGDRYVPAIPPGAHHDFKLAIDERRISDHELIYTDNAQAILKRSTFWIGPMFDERTGAKDGPIGLYTTEVTSRRSRAEVIKAARRTLPLAARVASGISRRESDEDFRRRSTSILWTYSRRRAGGGC